MPVFVEWKWVERTKSLLTIFHFYDDFSKSNLRFMDLGYNVDAGIYSPKWDREGERELPSLDNPWISWAPSHLEMALLVQLLCQANIINGLKVSEKKKLWFELEGKPREEYPYTKEKDMRKFAVAHIISEKVGKDKKVLLYGDLREEVYERAMRTCVELCPEYIEYLRKTLEPYLK